MSGSLLVSYDKEADVLEIRSEEPAPSFGEEIQDGVYRIVRENDNRVIGLTVIDFAKRQVRGEQMLRLPIACDLTQLAAAK